jgi:hypothetical protein
MIASYWRSAVQVFHAGDSRHSGTPLRHVSQRHRDGARDESHLTRILSGVARPTALARLPEVERTLAGLRGGQRSEPGTLSNRCSIIVIQSCPAMRDLKSNPQGAPGALKVVDVGADHLCEWIWK